MRFAAELVHVKCSGFDTPLPAQLLPADNYQSELKHTPQDQYFYAPYGACGYSKYDTLSHIIFCCIRMAGVAAALPMARTQFIQCGQYRPAVKHPPVNPPPPMLG